MGGKGGQQADQSGMFAAMASAQAADKAYQLGEQQFQWSKQVWDQEQPLIDAAEQAQINLSTQQAGALTQMKDETQQQWENYLSTYQPLEQAYVNQAANWASPAAIAQARGAAMGSVAEQGMAGINTAAETLRAYGVNPGSKRYASLYTGAQPMLGAAEAAAGTTAAENLRLQQMGLEAGAINTGRGLVNATGTLTQAGTGAGQAGSQSASGAASTAQGNLTGTGVGAGATSQLFNAGTGAMTTYVNAVDGYNQANADFAKSAAGEMGGFGSTAGTIAGALIGKIAKGGDVKRYELGGDITQGIPQSPTDFVGGDERDWLNKAQPPAPPSALAYPGDAKNITTHVHPVHPLLPRRSFGMDLGGPTDPQLTPTQGGGDSGIPSAPIMPAQLPPGQEVPPSQDGTTGGGVQSYMSPSGGQQTDDVPAQLNVGEYVVDKAAAQWIGHKQLAKMVDKARTERQSFDQRDDVGGEPTMAIPQQPTFVSRPAHMATTRGAIPGMPA